MEAHRWCGRLDYAFKAPIRSMSTTTRKPFEDCALTAATKLPSAPEISTSMVPTWLAALSNARPTASKSRTRR